VWSSAELSLLAAPCTAVTYCRNMKRTLQETPSMSGRFYWNDGNIFHINMNFITRTLLCWYSHCQRALLCGSEVIVIWYRKKEVLIKTSGWGKNILHPDQNNISLAHSTPSQLHYRRRFMTEWIRLCVYVMHLQRINLPYACMIC
jgi:hypothetical protein